MTNWDVTEICMKFDDDNSGDICADEFSTIVDYDATWPDAPDAGCKCGKKFLKADDKAGDDNGELDSTAEIVHFLAANWTNPSFDWGTQCTTAAIDEITWAEAECFCEGLEDDSI